MKPVLAYHVIFSSYGFWLPNDPRGSWSDFVGSWDLFRYGPATKTNERRSLAYDAHDRQKRREAKTALQRPPVLFTGMQARAVGRGIGNYVGKSGLILWACAILPDHVHMVVGRFRISIESIVIQLKGEATAQLLNEGIHPFLTLRDSNGRTPKCFGRGEWSVFLDDPEDIARSIRYVEDNPEKEGKPRQRWYFVKPYQPDSFDHA